MKNETKTFELQFDEKPNGYVIRLNDEKGCVLRICQIPKELIENDEFIDVVYPKPTKTLSMENKFKFDPKIYDGKTKNELEIVLSYLDADIRDYKDNDVIEEPSYWDLIEMYNYVHKQIKKMV